MYLYLNNVYEHIWSIATNPLIAPESDIAAKSLSIFFLVLTILCIIISMRNIPHHNAAVEIVENLVSDQRVLISANPIKAIISFPSVPTFAFLPSFDHCTLKTINPMNNKNGLTYSGSKGKNTVASNQHQAGFFCIVPLS